MHMHTGCICMEMEACIRVIKQLHKSTLLQFNHYSIYSYLGSKIIMLCEGIHSDLFQIETTLHQCNPVVSNPTQLIIIIIAI
jgi:hypothetical protein